MRFYIRFWGIVFLGVSVFSCGVLLGPDRGSTPIDTRGMVKVIFDANGGDWERAQVPQWEYERALPKGTELIFPEHPPFYEGWVLTGWYRNALPPLGPADAIPEGRIENDAKAEEDETFYALWQEKPANAFIVTFKRDKQDRNPVTRLALVENGFCITEEDMPEVGIQANWDAIGQWWTLPEGGEEFRAGTAVAGDITVYAHWTGKIRKVSFHLNGGAWPENTPAAAFSHFPADASNLAYCSVQYPVTKLSAIPETLPVKTVPGSSSESMVFLGWGLIKETLKDHYADMGSAEALTVALLSVTDAFAEDVTVYALWQRPDANKVPVYFNTYSGQKIVRYACRNGSSYKVAQSDFPPNPVRTGYAFFKWSKTESGVVSEFTENTAVSAGERNPSESACYNVYACWNV
ncbi:MAG: InlB B-repeat-containing protein, partial [Spirochaetaceae bacterium]|nr:InlB B-repeat-containing protein [Spirochaetaceae bacterium]